MTLKQIERMRQIIKEDSWPLDAEDWPLELNECTNCLAFALGLTFPDKDKEIFNCEMPIQKEVEGFLRILELQYREIKSVLDAKKDEYVLVCFENSAFGPHVIRRNLNWKWVHKEGWHYAPTDIVDWDYYSPEEIISIFAVKKGVS